MKPSNLRTFFLAGAGLLIGALVATTAAPADACSCALLTEFSELQLVSADSNDADEVARWTETAEIYPDLDSVGMQVGELYLLLGTAVP